MADFFRSALGYISNTNTKDSNDFVGQYVELGSQKLRVKRVIAEGGLCRFTKLFTSDCQYERTFLNVRFTICKHQCFQERRRSFSFTKMFFREWQTILCSSFNQNLIMPYLTECPAPSVWLQWPFLRLRSSALMKGIPMQVCVWSLHAGHTSRCNNSHLIGIVWYRQVSYYRQCLVFGTIVSHVHVGVVCCSCVIFSYACLPVRW